MTYQTGGIKRVNKRDANIQLKLWHSLAIQQLGGKCVKCGTIEKLHIHHKDGNWKNNEPSNLQLLCKTHHRQNHFLKSGETTKVSFRCSTKNLKKIDGLVQNKTFKTRSAFFNQAVKDELHWKKEEKI